MYLYYSSDDDIVNPVKVNEIVTNFELQLMPKFISYYELYKGKHPILNRTMTDTNKPNNKLVNDFYGQVIDTTVGYFLGHPITISVEEDKAQEAIDEIFKRNDKDDLFMEIGKEMCIKGVSGLLVFQDELSKTKLVRVPAEEAIFIYDENKPDQLLAGVRFYYIPGNYASNISTPYDTSNPTRNNYALNKRYVEVYTKDEVWYYLTSQEQGTLIFDTTRPNPVKHIYGQVPLIPFYNNEEEMGDLEKIKSLVDDFDRVFSDSSNEHEAYRNAYLMIRNMVINNEGLQKLKEEGVIEVTDDGDVKFVVKNIPTQATKEHLDRLKDNIFKFSHCPDLSDEKFGSNLSGVAIKFKLFGLETKSIIKERKMTKAIRRLIDILQVPLKVSTGVVLDSVDVDIQFTRNIPTNVTELVDEVVKLGGIVDKETLLGLLPFIDDPKEIIDKLKEEQDVYVGTFTGAVNGQVPVIGGSNSEVQAGITARMNPDNSQATEDVGGMNFSKGGVKGGKTTKQKPKAK